MIHRPFPRLFSAFVALVLVAAAVGCKKESACQTLCNTMVNDCNYSAYPSLESCVQGCNYDEQQGVDIAAESTCLDKTSCDPIGAVECARKFNPSGS